MLSQDSILRRLDPRALPIAVKIAIGLGLGLLAASWITSQVITQVVRDSQVELALNDLKAFSRSEGFRVVDALSQETVSLSRIGTNVQVQETLINHLSTDVEGRAGDSLYVPNGFLNNQMVSFRDTHGEFDAVMILDNNGHILGSDPAPTQLDQVKSPNWIWFVGALNNGAGGTFISGPQDDQVTGLTGIHIAVPVYSQQSPGVVIGVVYGIWNMSNVQEIVSSISDREGGVLEADGTVLLAADQNRGDSTAPELLERFRQTEGDAFVYTAPDGRQWLYGHTHLSGLGVGDPSINDLGWIVLSRQPITTVETNVALLTGRLQLVLLISGVGITLLILLFSRFLFMPLRRLTSAAVQIEKGKLDTVIPQFPQDEIGQLSRVLNSVVAQLLNRIQQMRSAVQVSRASALSLDVNQMLADLAATLTDQFGYPDVRIYLTDNTGKRLRLQAAAGAESERLLRVGYRIPLDETNIVGRSMLLNEPLLGGGKEILRAAGLITEHSELAVPLQAGGQPLGALHLLAGRLREFNPEDADVIRLIADQLSASIQNARLFEQSQESLREIEELNRRLTRQGWEEYVGVGNALRHTLDPEQQWPQTSQEIRKSVEIKAEVLKDENGRSVLAAPLMLRGEAVGSLSVTRPSGESWSRDEMLLIEAIASRMAIIAEGIRLVDESNLRAQREQQVNEISANLLQRATNVETVLRSALNELGGALGSDRISLRIGSAPARDDHQIGSGQSDGDGEPSNGDGSGLVTDTTEPPASLPGNNGDGGHEA